MSRHAVLLLAFSHLLFIASPAFAQDKGIAVTAKPAKPLPVDPKGGVWDDGHKPVTPNTNPKGGTWDDGHKLVAPNPAVNPEGTIWDDGQKPVAPKP